MATKVNLPKNWKKSQYFTDLEPTDKQRYLKKLTLNNNHVLPNPYAITEGWEDNVLLLPDIAYPDIYNNVLLPELKTRKLDPMNDKKQKTYCYCKRPSFHPMIGCDSLSCKIEWYHYSKPKKNKKWFCPDCIKK